MVNSKKFYWLDIIIVNLYDMTWIFIIKLVNTCLAI